LKPPFFFVDPAAAGPLFVQKKFITIPQGATFVTTEASPEIRRPAS
jgi:hypothetical protein